jgi:glutathione S-transferase
MAMVPATILSAAVTILAVLFMIYCMWNVGKMRGKHGIKAPATTGPVEFESAIRVQENTVEQALMFLPLLWVATIYFRTLGWLPPLFGLIWVIGRFVYLQGYMSAPERRSTGFTITALATVGLLVLSIIGVVQAWLAVHAM